MHLYTFILTISLQCLVAVSFHSFHKHKGGDLRRETLHNKVRSLSSHKRFFEFSPFALVAKHKPHKVEDNSKRFFHFSPFVSLPKVNQLISPVPSRRKVKTYKSGYIIGNTAPAGLKPYIDHFSGIRSFALHLFRPKKETEMISDADSYLVKERSGSQPRTESLWPFLQDDSFKASTTNDKNIFGSFYKTNGIEIERSGGQKDVLNLLQGQNMGKSLDPHYSGSNEEFKSSYLRSGEEDTLSSFNYGLGFHDNSIKHISHNDHRAKHDLMTTPEPEVFSDVKDLSAEKLPQQTPLLEDTAITDGFGSFQTDYNPDYFDIYQLNGEDDTGNNGGFASFGSFASDSVRISFIQVRNYAKI